MNYRAHLSSSLAYLGPEPSLEGLSSTDAERRLEGATHSIAEIVAHLAFWEEWWYRRCSGDRAEMVTSAAQGWPAVATGGWPDVHARFLDGLKKLSDLPEETHTRPISPAIEFPPLAHHTIGEGLLHVSIHNSHHLGQVIVLRQLLGCWPPPAGSYTW